MLSMIDRIIEQDHNTNTSINVRRNTISKSKTLKADFQTKELKFIFVKMLSDLTKKLNQSNYRVSRIRVHLLLKDSEFSNVRFSISLRTPTNHFSVILKAILPVYLSKLKQEKVIKIAIAFEKLSRSEEKQKFILRKIFYKKTFQN